MTLYAYVYLADAENEPPLCVRSDTKHFSTFVILNIAISGIITDFN